MRLGNCDSIVSLIRIGTSAESTTILPLEVHLIFLKNSKSSLNVQQLQQRQQKTPPPQPRRDLTNKKRLRQRVRQAQLLGCPLQQKSGRSLREMVKTKKGLARLVQHHLYQPGIRLKSKPHKLLQLRRYQPQLRQPLPQLQLHSHQPQLQLHSHQPQLQLQSQL